MLSDESRQPEENFVSYDETEIPPEEMALYYDGFYHRQGSQNHVGESYRGSGDDPSRISDRMSGLEIDRHPADHGVGYGASTMDISYNSWERRRETEKEGKERESMERETKEKEHRERHKEQKERGGEKEQKERDRKEKEQKERERREKEQKWRDKREKERNRKEKEKEKEKQKGGDKDKDRARSKGGHKGNNQKRWM